MKLSIKNIIFKKNNFIKLILFFNICMKRNVNELQFGNNTNNLNFKISKQQKKK